ncbi:MAG: pectate lyase [Cyclobacteriaceae bacterium]|nr:pectate lyase [Cyclobacteriaceae bacterium]UYN88588.1 MAG: pectate lyase [Cyclobacteriaceae bacterium]
MAFPGAEGFGKYTTGGRGGAVHVVTNLNDDGPGSLREAIKKKGPRIIVFAVSGYIDLKEPLYINDPDVTIAGQTAPGDGITLRHYPLKISTHNVIIRYLRFRLGDESGTEDDAISGTRQKNIIIDHCSMSWATDECASFYGNENFTLQWCIISESLNSSVHAKGDHGYGGIWGGKKASFHHNLIANHNSRLPRFSGSATVPNTPDELVDFRNNVIYNWMNNNTYGGEKGRYNIVNNYYKPGPATKSNRKERILDPSKPYGKFFVQGNVLEGYNQISQDNRLGITVNPDSVVVNQPFSVEKIAEQAAQGSYELVLRGAGASLKRDVVDARIIEEVKTGTASYGKSNNGIIDSQNDVGGWPELKLAVAPKDSDGDGMPDEWEIKNKLNPKSAADASQHTLSKSYTNIEVYINSLVEVLVQLRLR